MFGPLFQLQWVGLLCPCLQKDEDGNARQALAYINQAGRRVLWIRADSKSSGFSLGRVGNFFRSGSNASGSAGGSEDVARLILHDNSNGIPELLVDPTVADGMEESENTEEEFNLDDSDDNKNNKKNKPGFKLNIKLGRIDKVSLDGEHDIVLKARLVAGNKDGPKELLRLRVLNRINLPVAAEERNLFVHHMAVLVEWERQRRAAAGDEYGDDEDDDDQPNFLQARAQKAAHFAKRELEMQQTKREREKRKAKLVAESGGLKYTALAMANRS